MKENVIKEKTFDFSVKIIELYKYLRKYKEFVISKQLLRSATSIGANVKEAQSGQSRADFLSKMCIAFKEAQETEYWLELLQKSKLVDKDYTEYIKEIKEIINILSSITKTTKNS
ncbi:MAG: four helix bundle protein [Ignavibacteriae bacterium]|nr:four helix bundle protein [Ignavibacteriota bacterium]